MGAGVSNWRLAQAVSRIGQLGVVSGTGLADIVARRLQDGDPGGHIRRALAHFPFPRMAKNVLDSFFISGGKSKSTPYLTFPMFELEGHANPVGINYLEKLQLPHLSSIYGALLAGAAVVIMGAGIPLAVPEVLSALSRHEPAEYPIYVLGKEGRGESVKMTFDPFDYIEGDALPPVLDIPDFIPIVSSEALASILLRKASGPIDGFIVESNSAGGHNAPPRGRLNLNDAGEPIYGPKDNASFAAFRDIGLPFWMAGSCGSAEGLQRALDEGAEGVQVGTAFALCEESGLLPDVRHELIRKALAGEVHIHTDSLASPTGFPFKVAELSGSLSEDAVYQSRRRGCDLGFLRQPYRRDDGKIGYRCAAEPVSAYVAKGGRVEDTVGRKCLCNALIANVGMAQRMPDGTDDKCLITMGDDLANAGRFCSSGSADFSAEDVVRVLLGA